MKREDLKKIEGITDAIVDAVMKLHQTDAEAWKAEKTTLTNEAKTKDDKIKELNDSIKSFDGVDVKALQKSVDDWEKKYNTDMANAKKASAIDIALSKAGAKNEKMLRALIDMEKVTIKDGVLAGLDDQIEAIKKDNGFLFGTDTDVNLGGNHDGNGPSKEEEEAKAIAEAFGIKQ